MNKNLYILSLTFILLSCGILETSTLHSQECCGEEGGCWTWTPYCIPDWCDVAYFAPKVCYETLRVKQNMPTIADFLGIEQGKKLNGTLWGLDGGYIYKHPCGLYGQIEGTYMQGKLHGSHTEGLFVYDFDVEGTVGYPIYSYNFTFTPFIGIGYEFDRQRFDEEDEDEETVEMRYHIIYVPFGLNIHYAVTPCFAFGVRFKATAQADSTLRVTKFNHSRLELTKTTGYLVEIPFVWHIPCYNFNWKVILIPYWKYNVYGQSHAFDESGVNIFSPKQTYIDTGAKIEVGTLF